MTAVQMASLTRRPHRGDGVARRAAEGCDSPSHRRGRSRRPSRSLSGVEGGRGLRSILNSAVTNQPETNTMLYAAVVDTEGAAVAHSIPTAEGSVLPVLEDLIVFKDASALEQVTRRARRASVRAAGADSAGGQGLRRDPHRRLDLPDPQRDPPDAAAVRLHRGGGARDLDDGRDAAGAVDAAADSRDSERPQPAGTRRARRPAGPPGPGVRRPRQLVRGRQRAAGRGAGAGVAARLDVDRVRVGRWRTSRTQSACSRPRASSCSATPRCGRCCRRSVPGRPRPRRRCRCWRRTTRCASWSSARSPAGSRPVRRGAARDGGRRSGSARVPAALPRDRGRARQVPRRDARRAQSRIPEPRPHDARTTRASSRRSAA